MKEIDIILKNIKNKELLPVYFFQGDEAFYIDLAVKHFEQDVLEEDEKAFNQTIAYGRDTGYLEILSLKIQQEDVYTRDCSQYCVVTGRVTANNGLGIPNASLI